MTVLLWTVVAYLLGAAPWLPARSGHESSGKSWTYVIDVVKAVLPVVAAAGLSGPYDASAAAIGVVSGHFWPPGSRPEADERWTPVAAIAALLPVEVVGGALVFVAAVLLLHRRPLGLLALLASVPAFAVLRHQRAPLVVAAVAICGMLLARRVERERGGSALHRALLG
jgi:glycerol-3-phosphate acyltransferase PlsY